jgi:hypothetical protein
LTGCRQAELQECYVDAARLKVMCKDIWLDSEVVLRLVAVVLRDRLSILCGCRAASVAKALSRCNMTCGQPATTQVIASRQGCTAEGLLVLHVLLQVLLLLFVAGLHRCAFCLPSKPW